ncbi:hypothetical protein [Serratia marcescens]|uniref:hypothetical protein n=1 Tax=Serratia marcescens TaxID=615 RepID=UPI0011E6E875|nr:hypothetical protein [Serratia marcescens]
MKGSEKQIAWAEEIKGIIIDTAKEAINGMLNDERFDSQNPKHVSAIEKYKNWIAESEKEDRSWFFIDNFKEVRDSNTTMSKRIKIIMVSIIVNGLTWKK